MPLYNVMYKYTLHVLIHDYIGTLLAFHNIISRSEHSAYYAKQTAHSIIFLKIIIPLDKAIIPLHVVIINLCIANILIFMSCFQHADTHTMIEGAVYTLYV